MKTGIVDTTEDSYVMFLTSQVNDCMTTAHKVVIYRFSFKRKGGISRKATYDISVLTEKMLHINKIRCKQEILILQTLFRIHA